MTDQPTDARSDSLPSADVVYLVALWERSLVSTNRSAKTIKIYGDSARRLCGYVDDLDQGPIRIEDVTRAVLTDFFASLFETLSASTVSIHYRALQQFFRFLVAEDEIRADPMATMSPPLVPEQPVEVLTPEQLEALWATCSKPTWRNRRDLAILRLLGDTGVRRAELADVQFGDLDIEHRIVVVLGKGRRERPVPFGSEAAAALDRYLLKRRRHPHAELPWLWLGEKGRLTGSGLAQVVRRRGRMIGIPNLHPHQFRHTFAHQWLASGGTEADLMKLAGWRTRSMVDRYGASAATARAIANYRSNFRD